MCKWPGVFTFLNNKRLKILEMTNLSEMTNLKSAEIKIDKAKIFIGCGNKDTVEILELQLEGKNKMTAKEFINGNKNLNGAILSS